MRWAGVRITPNTKHRTPRLPYRISLAEADKVLNGLGHNPSVQSHDDSARRYAVDFNVEKHLLRYRGLSPRTKEAAGAQEYTSKACQAPTRDRCELNDNTDVPYWYLYVHQLHEGIQQPLRGGLCEQNVNDDHWANPPRQNAIQTQTFELNYIICTLPMTDTKQTPPSSQQQGQPHLRDGRLCVLVCDWQLLYASTCQANRLRTTTAE